MGSGRGRAGQGWSGLGQVGARTGQGDAERVRAGLGWGQGGSSEGDEQSVAWVAGFNIEILESIRNV